LEEPSEEWDRANRGWKITSVWLGRKLRGVLPEGEEARRARVWKVGKKVVRGYPIAHFEAAFRRYLPTTRDSTSSGNSVPNQDEPTTTFQAVSPQFHSTEPSGASNDASPMPQFHSTEQRNTVAAQKMVAGGLFEPQPETPSSDLQNFDGCGSSGSKGTFDTVCVVSDSVELTNKDSIGHQLADNVDNLSENADSTDDQAQLPDRELW
jgi:hypothetical protein